MQIFAKTETGKTIHLNADAKDTISMLKCQIEKVEGIPEDWQKLSLAGMELQDGHTVENYKIQTRQLQDLQWIYVKLKKRVQ